ncbi:MAG: FxsA family protein [Pelagibacteraceae bacterium]
MNSFLLLIIGIPAAEILLMIKVGQKFGALNTVFLIFLTAVIGVYYARVEGLNTIRSGFLNLYQNKTPVYEIISGASIAIAAILLMIPGFLTDTVGFILLFKPTRNLLINRFLKNKKYKEKSSTSEVLEGEILEEKNKKDD